MITTHFDPNEISKECLKIIKRGGQPVIYTALYNLQKMESFPFKSINDDDDDYDYISPSADEEAGYVGRFRGCPVYATKSVGNLWVVVPQYKEN